MPTAYIVAIDSLQVLLQQGKRQSEVMEAVGSAAAITETGAPVPCLDEITGGGMHIEEDLDDLDDTQVTEPGGKKMERRQRDAAVRATAEVEGYYVPSDTSRS